MIGFGVRLAIAGGKEAATRLIIIAAAVAVGVGLLLATLAAVNGINAQNARYAWLNSGSAVSSGPQSPDPTWWKVSGGYFQGQTTGRVDVAATGPQSPVPPGIPRLPGPGEYYASPALTALLRSTPADQLSDRFPGHQIGTVGAQALPAPDFLLIVVGRTPEEMSKMEGVSKITKIFSNSPSDCNGCFVGISDAGIKLMLSVVAGGLLFPVFMFIGTATRLSAARREERFAAMRLIGATPRQISQISAAEAMISAIAGTAVGFGLFYAFRNVLAGIAFTGSRFFPADLSIGPGAILGVTFGVPLAAAAAALLALRRVQISPLGVSRRVTPRAPRAYRLIPLLLGIGELAYFVGRRPRTTDAQVLAYLPGFLVTMIGLVIAGPWLTMVGARLLARRATRPATLIAARRLADNPKAGFRSISGLVLALFVATAALGVISTIVAERATPTNYAGATNLAAYFSPDQETPDLGRAAELTAIPGVSAVAVVRAGPREIVNRVGVGPYVMMPGDLAACADIARGPTFGHCEPGAEVAWVFSDLLQPDSASQDAMAWPTADMSLEALRQLPVQTIVVGTDGSKEALERSRTRLTSLYPLRHWPSTDAEDQADQSTLLNRWKQLANAVIVASLIIAGCSLAVSVVGGLSERKRPFSMLRLAGVPLGVLRRVITLEGAAPLLAAAGVAIVTGLLAAHLFLRAQMFYSLVPPDVSYYLIVAAGLFGSLGIMALTLPLLRRITGPETARNE